MFFFLVDHLVFFLFPKLFVPPSLPSKVLDKMVV